MAGYIGKSQSVSLSSVSTDTVETQDIQDGAVTNVKVASGVDAGKLTTGTLPIARIADGAVTDAKIDGMSSSKLSGALPAIDGSALTGISSASDILQVVSGSTTGEWSTVNPSNNTWIDSGWTINFTPESATSKFILYIQTRLSVKKTDAAFHGASMRWKKTQNSTTTYPSQLGGSMTGNFHHQLTDNFQGSTVDPHSIPVTFFAIESSSSTNQISYLMQYGAYNLTTTNDKVWAGSQWSFPSSYQIIEFEE